MADQAFDTRVWRVVGSPLQAGVPVETVTAPAIQALLDSGADVVGIAQTDQFAYSIAGLNPDYGTPHGSHREASTFGPAGPHRRGTRGGVPGGAGWLRSGAR